MDKGRSSVEILVDALRENSGRLVEVVATLQIQTTALNDMRRVLEDHRALLSQIEDTMVAEKEARERLVAAEEAKAQAIVDAAQTKATTALTQRQQLYKQVKAVATWPPVTLLATGLVFWVLLQLGVEDFIGLKRAP